MVNKDELVIRWLEEPVDVPCALCKSKKSKKFKKGPVVSLVGGELVCPKCATKYNKNLWDVYSSYGRHLEDLDLKLPSDDLRLDKLDFKEPIVPEFDDKEFLKTDKYDDFQVPEYEPLFKEEERCARCVHAFSPRTGPKTTK